MFYFKKSKYLLLSFFALAFTNFICNSNLKTEGEKPADSDKNWTSQDKKINTANSSLQWYNLEDENAKYIKLSNELRGISGICFSTDDRLFCETDENANIYQIDSKSGEIIKKFSLKDSVNSGDFEDICIVGDRFFLIQDHGGLFEFKEGANNSGVDYKVYKTFLTRENNIEGLCFDPETNSLLLACKKYAGDGYDKMKAVYSFAMNTMTLNEKPRFLISTKPLKKLSSENKFNPSGIARNPATGTFFIIASRGNIIIEVTKEGDVLGEKDLPKSIHIQPEGIAFSKDNTLYISNEGKGKTAGIVAYTKNK